MLTVAAAEGTPLAATVHMLATRGAPQVEVTGVIKQGEIISMTGIVQK